MHQNLRTQQVVDIVLIGMFFILVLAIALLAWVPPVSRDALIHHLAIPKLWIEHGCIYETPEFSFSYYPMNLDLLYTVPLILNNDILPKFIHFIFGILTGWLVYRYLEKRISRTYGLIGALFFLSIPVVVKLSITVYVDLGLIFFSTAALLQILEWVNNRYALKNLLLAAIFCGLALGTKYNALVVFFLLSVSIPFCYLRLSQKNKPSQLKAIGYGLIFVAVSLIFFSPWMIKNYLWTKNPVYPLYNSWFDNEVEPKNISATSDNASAGESDDNQDKIGWGHFTTRKFVYQESLEEILTIPLRIFFQGRDDDPKFFDGKLNPFLLLLPLLAFLTLGHNPNYFRTEKIFLLTFCILYLLITFLQTDMRIRYIAPIIPPLVVLSVSGLKNLFSAGDLLKNQLSAPYYKIAGLIVITLMLGMNASYLYGQFKTVDPLPYISGKVGRDDFISRHRPEYPSIQYINIHLPENSKILGVFLGNRGYYFEKTIIFDFSFIKKSVKEPSRRDSLGEAFYQQQITHIILRHDLFNSWVKNTFDQNETLNLETFFRNHTRLLFSQTGYGVYALNNTMPTQEAKKPYVQ